MRILHTILPVVTLAMTGCSHDYQTVYGEFGPGAGFNVGCIVDTVKASQATDGASDIKLLTNGVLLTQNSHPVLVTYDENVEVSNRVSVFGNSGTTRINNNTTKIANSVYQKCRVSGTHGTNISEKRTSTTVRFSLQPSNPSWTIDYST